MRIAFVITGLEFGGAEKCLVSLACGLDRRRFETTVYSLAARPAAPADGLVRCLEESDIPVHFLDLKSSWQIAAAIDRLGACLARDKPDLLQCFLFHANVMGAAIAQAFDVPHVCIGLRVTEQQTWRRWLLRRIDHLASCRVCVSQAVAKAADVRARARAKRAVVIPNGVRVADFAERPPADLTQFGFPSGQQAITFVGRLHRQKGLHWLLKLLPEVFAALPRHDLLLVGAGPLEAKLKRLAESLGISRRVHFAGWCGDVAGVLRASSLFVLPSRWEGMPNALLEAMAAGLPAVATNVEGVAELLGAGNEQVVPAGDKDAFQRTLIRLGSEPAAAARLGAANRQTVEQSFSVETMIERYQDLYESLG